jgi:hypothetical protein
MCGNLPCFEAGEDRTSENIALISIQTLFLRDHNRVASQLAIVNPTWSDETLYQEARRIVIAELQHITFNEYLPVLDYKLFNSLKPYRSGSGYYRGYDSTINTALYNEFAAAAFRFGHSLINYSFNFSFI